MNSATKRMATWPAPSCSSNKHWTIASAIEQCKTNQNIPTPSIFLPKKTSENHRLKDRCRWWLVPVYVILFKEGIFHHLVIQFQVDVFSETFPSWKGKWASSAYHDLPWISKGSPKVQHCTALIFGDFEDVGKWFVFKKLKLPKYLFHVEVNYYIRGIMCFFANCQAYCFWFLEMMC